jgi:DNA-directed RNA polymerase specialized sigma24 family protein
MALKDRIIGAGFAAFRLSGLHRIAARATRGQGAALMFHSVRPWRLAMPGFSPNRLLEITPEFLDETLSLVKRMGFDIVALDEALQRLAAHDRRKSEIVELLSFGGLTYDEAAVALKISPATVHRELKMAKAWLRRELTRDSA